MRCQSKEDFDALSTLISDLIISKHGNHPLYAMFVNKLVVDVAAPLKDVECRKAASGLTTLSNAKQAEAKAGKGKGKKAGKPALGASKTVGTGRADMSTYDEVLDDGDYDDFVSHLLTIDPL
jgi:translation initiation factor 3 subunit J